MAVALHLARVSQATNPTSHVCRILTVSSAATFVVAVASAFILPDDPLQTKWLTPSEREHANARIVADTVGAKVQTSSWKGLKEAGKDPKIWLFAFMQHMHLAANGFKNFFPTAVETLGFSQTITLYVCLSIMPLESKLMFPAVFSPAHPTSSQASSRSTGPTNLAGSTSARGISPQPKPSRSLVSCSLPPH